MGWPAVTRPISARGFTLVEILVALVLLGLLAAMVTGGLRFGIRAWESGERRADDLTTIQSVQALLDGMVTQAAPVPNLDTDLPDFVGTPDELDFIGPLPAHLGMGGLFRIRLKSLASNRARDLAMWWIPHHPEITPDDFADETPTLLIGGAESIRFEYFGSDDPRTPGRWSDTWRDMPTLPQLVRIDVIFDRDDPRRWPQMVVAPRISLDTSCVRDPNQQYCRRLLIREQLPRQ